MGLTLLLACGSGVDESTPTADLQFDSDNGGIELPEGFAALVVADNLGKARQLSVAENGDIYVALQEANQGESIVALRDTNGDGRADIERRFGGDSGGRGLELRNGFLYFAPDTEVRRYPLRQGELVPEETYQVIATGFPLETEHAAKTFAFDDQERLYVNVGGPSNACQEKNRELESPGQDPCPLLERHAGIWRFNADALEQDHVRDGRRYATGIRNAVAIAWNPIVNKLYVLQHGRDQFAQLWPELFDYDQSAELPAEEFFLVEEGSNFGWPYCYYDQIQGKKVLGPEYGGDGKEIGRCEQFQDPIAAFPAHWAPNDLLFYTAGQFPDRYQGGAFIAFHGSWNRSPRPEEGYKVVFVPFQGERPSGAWETFADGFAGVDEVDDPSDARFRPCGLAQGPDGSLYIADSQKGRIWRVVYADGEGQSR